MEIPTYLTPRSMTATERIEGGPARPACMFEDAQRERGGEMNIEFLSTVAVIAPDWGQTVARMQSPEGAIVGISYAPVLHDEN